MAVNNPNALTVVVSSAINDEGLDDIFSLGGGFTHDLANEGEIKNIDTEIALKTELIKKQTASIQRKQEQKQENTQRITLIEEDRNYRETKPQVENWRATLTRLGEEIEKRGGVLPAMKFMGKGTITGGGTGSVAGLGFWGCVKVGVGKKVAQKLCVHTLSKALAIGAGGGLVVGLVLSAAWYAYSTNRAKNEKIAADAEVKDLEHTAIQIGQEMQNFLTLDSEITHRREENENLTKEIGELETEVQGLSDANTALLQKKEKLEGEITFRPLSFS